MSNLTTFGRIGHIALGVALASKDMVKSETENQTFIETSNDTRLDYVLPSIDVNKLNGNKKPNKGIKIGSYNSKTKHKCN